MLAIVNKEANQVGIRCITYNTEGRILAKISKSQDKEELHLALRGGWRKIGFFSDSKVVIE